MNALKQPRTIAVLLTVLAGGVLAYQAWKWAVERVEVPTGKFLVLINRWGKDLPEEQILAPDDSYKGVLFAVKAPGRHFVNPITQGYEIHDVTEVKPGECLVLTRKFGAEIPPERVASGDFLANGKVGEVEGVERGVLKEPLREGQYLINPHAFDKAIVKAVRIPDECVGVRTVKVGKDPKTLERKEGDSQYLVSKDGYRGVQARYVPPGTYYLNPYLETIIPVEVRSHKVEFKDIQFPSKDGFMVKPHVTVEYAVMKEKAPEVLVKLTDEGILNQEDATEQDRAKNEILQKILLPHIRGYARIEGSNFNATDFITTTTQEKENAKAVNSRNLFEKALQKAVKESCEANGIEIRAVALGDVESPTELREEISARDRALAEQERNKQMVLQYKQEQALKAQEKQADQKRSMVEAQTRLNVAQTEAQQLTEVEKQKLEANLKVAQSQLDAAKEKAKSIKAQAQAEADVTIKQNQAEVAALKKSVEGFGGGQNFAQYQMMSKVGPALTEIFAADTSEFGKLFSTFMMLEKELEKDKKVGAVGPKMPPAADVAAKNSK